MAEAAAASKGLENALPWDVVIKTCTLIMLTCFSTVIAGVEIGDNTDPLLSWIESYADDTSKEGTDKNNGEKDPHGTADTWDILLHMAVSAYSYFVFSAIAIGAVVFYFMHSPLENVLVCEFDAPASAYANAGTLLSQVTDYDKCMAVIDQIFAMEDLNGNGIVSKCEDANFQHFAGATKEYATKFAGQYTLQAFRNLCYENFPNHFHESH